MVVLGFWVAPCTQFGPGEGCAMGGKCDSLLLFLSLSSLTCSNERLVSFAPSLFSSLFTWFVCFAIFDH